MVERSVVNRKHSPLVGIDVAQQSINNTAEETRCEHKKRQQGKKTQNIRRSANIASTAVTERRDTQPLPYRAARCNKYWLSLV